MFRCLLWDNLFRESLLKEGSVFISSLNSSKFQTIWYLTPLLLLLVSCSTFPLTPWFRVTDSLLLLLSRERIIVLVPRASLRLQWGKRGDS